MKFNIATKLAFFLSLAITILFSVVLYAFDIQLKNYYLIWLVIFGIVFLILKLSIQFFVSKQIKTIYNILYDGRAVDTANKTLSIVEHDALIWQQQKKQNLNDLEKQNNYRKEFIGNLSHELKTPLFSIQGYVETLIDGGIYDDQINMAYLKKASNNIDRLSAIVQDVDTIASVESDSLNLNKTVFSINDLIKDSIDSLELLADRNEITVVLNENSKSLKVLADKEKINRVLVNLISNSIKYGKEGGKTTLKLSSISDRVLVEIIDNGIGINKEQLHRVFERFYRVDSNRSREQGGSGLGLAIVKHVVEAHGQNINVKSVLGKRTTFSFTLSVV